MFLAAACAISLIVIFFSARFVIAEVGSLANRLHASQFGVSLILLGFLTSLTDISVGVNAQLLGRPDIYAGNFIGGSFVIIFLILPLLTVLKKGLPLGKRLPRKHLIGFVALISVPILVALDGRIGTIDSIIMVSSYALFLFFELGGSHAKKRARSLMNKRVLLSVGKIALAGVVIFICSHYLVEGTEQLAILIGIPAFVVSVVLLSLGTNIPELSLAITSVLKKKTDVAFGDYVGSASLNPLMLGVFSLINGPYDLGFEGFRPLLFVFLLGNALFLYVGLRKGHIPISTSLILIAGYSLVLTHQVLAHQP